MIKSASIQPIEVLSRNEKLDADEQKQLVEDIASGDRTAEERLVLAFQHPISIVIRRLFPKDPHRVQDLAQETLIIVLRRTREGSIRIPEQLDRFILRTAKYVALQNRDVDQNRDNLLKRYPLQAPDSPDHSAELLLSELRESVRQVISELPTERDREMLFRVYVLEQDKQVVCDALGLTERHYDRVSSRARIRFRELWPHGDDPFSMLESARRGTSIERAYDDALRSDQ